VTTGQHNLKLTTKLINSTQLLTTLLF